MRQAIMKNRDGTYVLGFDGLTKEQAAALILEAARLMQQRRAG